MVLCCDVKDGLGKGCWMMVPQWGIKVLQVLIYEWLHWCEVWSQTWNCWYHLWCYAASSVLICWFGKLGWGDPRCYWQHEDGFWRWSIKELCRENLTQVKGCRMLSVVLLVDLAAAILGLITPNHDSCWMMVPQWGIKVLQVLIYVWMHWCEVWSQTWSYWYHLWCYAAPSVLMCWFGKIGWGDPRCYWQHVDGFWRWSIKELCRENLTSEGMWDAISGSAGGFGSPWPNHGSWYPKLNQGLHQS